jgi:hypothetical protein
LIIEEFHSSVEALGRGGQDFDDERRVEDDVLFSVVDFDRPADDDEVRVKEIAGPFDLDFEIVRKGLTRTFFQLGPDLSGEVRTHAIVQNAFRRHRDHCIIEEFAFKSGLTFPFEVFVG